MEKLTKEKLIELGFECIREKDKDNDIDGIWYHDESCDIYEDFWEENVFNLAIRTKNGEFKSGYQIKYLEQLKEHMKSLDYSNYENQ